MKIYRISLGKCDSYAVLENGYYELCEIVNKSFSVGYGSEGNVRKIGEKILPDTLNLSISAPVLPKVIYAIGLNYREHAMEMKRPIPECPVVTMKSTTSLLNPEAMIELPRFLRSDQVDYECELAVLIGKTVRNVSSAEALNFVGGYTAANDVSARDWQNIYSGGQWNKGKSFDTFCPIGPCLVTSDEISNPNCLEIQTKLNDKLVQKSNTENMIFSVPKLIEFLSGSTTLEAGTLILTGTPLGVGIAQNPPRFLKPGDEVVIEIEQIGRLKNTVIEERI